ncbi:MAG: AAA family ATPase [Acidimicrobiales bacterium]
MRKALPFVGRATELAHLAKVSVAAAEGTQGVLLVGEAGVGKTRLLEEHARRASATGARVRIIVGTRSAATAPLSSLTSLLLPRLARAHTAVASDALFHEAVAALVADTRGRSPWLLAIDDLPNLDGASAAAVHQCLVATGAHFFATARPGEPAPAAFDALWREGRMVLMSVDPLTDQAIDELLEAVVEGPLDSWSRHRLIRLAAGNPLALRELVTSAKQTGSLRRSGLGWGLVDGFQTGEPLTALVEQRLATTPATVRGALELVALAEPVDLDALASLVGADVADELFDRGLVVLGDAQGATVRSGHPLFGEVLRSLLTPHRRSALAAELLSTLAAAPTPGPAMLRRAQLMLESGRSVDVAELAAAAHVARHVGDRALARRFADAALRVARADDSTQAAGASAALASAVVRVEVGDAPAADAFAEALRWARTDEEVLAVISEWSWAALFTEGLGAATAVVKRGEAQLTSRTARLTCEATAATFVGYVGRWSSAREQALVLAAQLRADDPAQLQLTVRTLLAMAGAFDGPGEVALSNGDAAQVLFERQPAIPTTQAICGIVGRLYGMVQLRGFDAAAHEARELTRKSLSGEAYVEYAGVWRGVIGNNAVAMAALTAQTRDDAEDAVRLLRWRDPCGVLSLSVASRGLFGALCGDLQAAVEILDDYDREFRARETKTTVLADRGRAWVAYQQGDLAAALEWAERAWAASWEEADVATWAAPAAHDLVRFGLPDRAVDRLSLAAARLSSPFAEALVAHAVGLVAYDAAAVEAAADRLGRCGAAGLQAEALLQAAPLAPERADELRAHALAVLEGSLLRTPLVVAALQAAPDQAQTTLTLCRTGGVWLVTYGTASVAVQHLVGLHHLDALVAQPGQDIPAWVLAAAAGADASTSPEQARISVRKAITRAISSLSDLSPEIGAYLRRSIVTGSTCRFAPPVESA